MCSFSLYLSSTHLFPPSFGKDKLRCCQECDCIWKTNPAHFSSLFLFSSTGSFFFLFKVGLWTAAEFNASKCLFFLVTNQAICKSLPLCWAHCVFFLSSANLALFPPNTPVCTAFPRQPTLRKTALCVKLLDAVCMCAFPIVFPERPTSPHLFISSQLIEKCIRVTRQHRDEETFRYCYYYYYCFGG